MGILDWLILTVTTVFALALFVAVLQDIRSRSISMFLSLLFIAISITGFVTREEWSGLIAYVLLNVVSTLLYSYTSPQVFGSACFIAGALYLPDQYWQGSFESRWVVIVMGIMWAFFFLSKRFWGERGGADFNVIFTTLSVFGVNGYIIFSLVAIVVGGYLTVLETILHSRKHTLTGVLFSVYMRFSDNAQRHEPITVNVNGKSETIPFIPILYVIDLFTLLIWGSWFWQQNWVWLPGGLMVLLPAVWFIKKRGWIKRELKFMMAQPDQGGSNALPTE